MPDRRENKATAYACANIAFIKYWGNRDEILHLPSNGSISMNLEDLKTLTTVRFDRSIQADKLTINGKTAGKEALERVSQTLEEVRRRAKIHDYAEVESENNFPSGTGMASSASGFAALALAATTAAGLSMSEVELSRLARRGSGSACRSIPSGFVEWQVGTGDEDSYAVSVAPPEYWDLADCIAIVSSEHKQVGSTEGHALAGTSPLQVARVADSPRRLDICRKAILQRDFSTFAEIMELDSNMMHAVMMTSHPALFYWNPATILVLETVRDARAKGSPVCYTIDAGPNVHVITLRSEVQRVADLVRNIPGVHDVRVAHVGGPARMV
jgi:diphosphomevalonate decarboxylase